MIINNDSLNNNAIGGIQSANESLLSNFSKLSSGKQINSASDDPAGLVISEQMRSRIAGLEQEIRNMETLSNKLQTTDGYLGTLSNNLVEMRATAIAAANEGGLDESRAEALQQSMDSTVQSFNSTIDNAAFGNQSLLNGSEGAEANISGLSRLDLSTPEKAAEAIQKIDTAIEEVNNTRGEVGARQANQVESSINNLRITLQNLTQAQSIISDTDYASEYSNMVANQIRLQTSAAMITQGNLIGNMVASMLNSPAHHVGV